MIPKDAILALRQQGRSYQKIAEQLILSPNTVKSVCRKRQPLTPVKTVERLCRQALLAEKEPFAATNAATPGGTGAAASSPTA